MNGAESTLETLSNNGVDVKEGPRLIEAMLD